MYDIKFYTVRNKNHTFNKKFNTLSELVRFMIKCNTAYPILTDISAKELRIIQNKLKSMAY